MFMQMKLVTYSTINDKINVCVPVQKDSWTKRYFTEENLGIPEVHYLKWKLKCLTT